MNCIIVDDEFPAIKELEYFIKNFSTIKIENTFESSIEALEYIQEKSVDVIFLDIHMPKLDGMSFSRVIKTLKIKPLIVFISAYSDYAVEAFEVCAFDYILKPYSQNRIVETLSKLEQTSTSSCLQHTITLWQNEKFIVLDYNQIYFCKANKHEVHVYTKTDEYILHTCLTDFYLKLPHDKFFKTHRSYIVNLDKISEIIPWFNNTYVLKLKGLNEEIPVSRQNISQFKTLIRI